MYEQARTALANMKVNFKRDVPWFHGVPAHGLPLVIVGGGPSLKRNWQFVRAYQKIGAKVCACNGALRFLREKGIEPDFACFVDVSPVVAGFLNDVHDDVLYLVASACHPSVFEKLDAFDNAVCMWHAENGAINGDVLTLAEQYEHKPFSLIGGGNTAVLRMLSLGVLMGFRMLHMFGVDSCLDTEGADHAYTKHDGPELDEVSTVTMRGKAYRVTPWMAAQAKAFAEFYPKIAAQARVLVHGDGLIPDTWTHIKALERRRAA